MNTHIQVVGRARAAFGRGDVESIPALLIDNAIGHALAAIEIDRNIAVLAGDPDRQLAWSRCSRTSASVCPALPMRSPIATDIRS
jgi:hypothetical protein